MENLKSMIMMAVVGLILLIVIYVSVRFSDTTHERVSFHSNEVLLQFQFFKQPPAPQGPVYLPPPPAQGGGGGGESGGGGGGGGGEEGGD